MVYSAQTPEAIAAELIKIAPSVVIADEQDWTPELEQAANRLNILGLAITNSDFKPVRVLRRTRGTSGQEPQLLSKDVAFQLLTSGTTGPPKRIALEWSALEAAISDARSVYAAPTGDKGATAQIVIAPLGNVSGVAYVAAPLVLGQPLALLEKFELKTWLDAIAAHRPSRIALPPAAMRMVIDNGVPAEALSSVQVVGTGGAALDPKLKELFEETYDVAVLQAYGATEFGGVIANWTLDDYRIHGATRPTSVGRARPGVRLRIVDTETDIAKSLGEIGLLEAITPRTGEDWVRTNDLASLDEGGFLYLHGRSDHAINRGGFKVVPQHVASVLEEHPAVREAVVLGIAHQRLGQVPVAAIEVREPLAAAEIEEFARNHLLAYQVPTAFCIVEALPRNQAMKVSLAEVFRLFDMDQPPAG